MLTSILAIFFPVVSHSHSSEDLEAMSRAFRRACQEHPSETETDEQRDQLAETIMSRYQRGLDEKDLVALALKTLH